MIASPSRLAAACLGCGISCGVLVPAACGQEIRTSAQVTTSGGYSKNPYNRPQDGSSAYGEVVLTPVVSALSEYTTWSLRGTARLRHYFSHFSDEDSYSANFSYRHRLNEHDSISAGLGVTDSRNRLDEFLDSDIGGTGGDTVGGTGGDAGGVVVPPPISGEDVSLIGTRTRRYRGYAGADFTISSRMSLSLNADTSLARYQSSGFGGYNTYGGTADLSRRLSERAQLGVFGSVTKTDYRDLIRPDSTVVSFGLSGSLQTSSRWSFSGQVGAAIVDNTGLDARRTVGIVGNVQGCRIGEYDSICVDASRRYLPTGLAGTEAQSTLGVNYTRRLNEHDSVSAAVDGTKGSGDLGQTENDSYLRGHADYRHDFGPRLVGSLSLFDRTVFGASAHRPSDYGATVSLTYRFGESR